MPQEFLDAAHPEETGEAIVVLLDITHEALAEPLHVTDAGGTWDEGLGCNVFVVGATPYIAFGEALQVIAPGRSDEEPTGRIVIPNIDQAIGRAIAEITSPATVTVTAVLESDPSIVVGGPHQFLELRDVEGDGFSFSGTIGRTAFLDQMWPKGWIRPSKFRAAFR